MSSVEKQSINAEGYVARGWPVPYHDEYGHGIDLGLATNPSGAAIEARTLHADIHTEQIAEYDENVHHTDIKKLLIEGIGIQGITHEDIIFHPNGSYGAGDEVIRALSLYLSSNNRRPTVYVPTYSFPNVAEYAARHGINYEPLPLGNTLFQSDSLKTILQLTNEDLNKNIVYVDYPNNPSGIADGVLLRQVVSHVSEQGGIPFVDLAFGEVLGDEFRDAIQFTIDQGGVCVGSLTKTQGLPALRAGYIILNPELSKQLYTKDTRLVFGLPVQVKQAYQILFTKDNDGKTQASDHAQKATQYNRETNEMLYEELEKLDLEIAPTNLETPIQIVLHGNKNLYVRLARAGIKTESLNDYIGTLPHDIEGYGNHAVRMLTPRRSQLLETIRRAKIAMDFKQEMDES